MLLFFDSVIYSLMNRNLPTTNPLCAMCYETITIGLKACDLNSNPTYTQIFTRMTKFEKDWYHSNHTHTHSVDILYLLLVAR